MPLAAELRVFPCARCGSPGLGLSQSPLLDCELLCGAAVLTWVRLWGHLCPQWEAPPLVSLLGPSRAPCPVLASWGCWATSLSLLQWPCTPRWGPKLRTAVSWSSDVSCLRSSGSLFSTRSKGAGAGRWPATQRPLFPGEHLLSKHLGSQRGLCTYCHQ